MTGYESRVSMACGITGPAATPAVVPAQEMGVGLIEWMPMFAVRELGECLDWSHSTQDVGASINRLKVRWIHAIADAAQMVNVQTNWDRPDEHGVCPTVGQPCSAVDATFTVAIRHRAASPNPASCMDWQDFAPEIVAPFSHVQHVADSTGRTRWTQ